MLSDPSVRACAFSSPSRAPRAGCWRCRRRGSGRSRPSRPRRSSSPPRASASRRGWGSVRVRGGGGVRDLGVDVRGRWIRPRAFRRPRGLSRRVPRGLRRAALRALRRSRIPFAAGRAAALWTALDVLRAHAGLSRVPLGLARPGAGAGPSAPADGRRPRRGGSHVPRRLARSRSRRGDSLDAPARPLAVPARVVALAARRRRRAPRGVRRRRASDARRGCAAGDPPGGARDARRRACDAPPPREAHPGGGHGASGADRLAGDGGAESDGATGSLRMGAEASRDETARLMVVGASQVREVPFEDAAGGTGFRLRQTNLAAVFTSGGSAAPVIYGKTLLVPFAEYLPAPSFPWPSWLVGKTFDVVPGDGPTVLRLADGTPFAPLICWENLFADFSRRSVAGGARLLVQLTNDNWFGATAAPAPARRRVGPARGRERSARRRLVQHRPVARRGREGARPRARAADLRAGGRLRRGLAGRRRRRLYRAAAGSSAPPPRPPRPRPSLTDRGAGATVPAHEDARPALVLSCSSRRRRPGAGGRGPSGEGRSRHRAAGRRGAQGGGLHGPEVAVRREDARALPETALRIFWATR